LPEPLFENFSGGFRIKFMLPEQAAVDVSKEAGVIATAAKRQISPFVSSFYVFFALFRG